MILLMMAHPLGSIMPVKGKDYQAINTSIPMQQCVTAGRA